MSRSLVPIGPAAGAAAVVLALAAVAAPASPRTITRGGAGAVAAAINLRHSDLPGTKQEANPVTPQDRRLADQATSCAGGVPLSRAYVNAQSPVFVGGSGASAVSIASGVEILPSTALVARDFAAIARPRALGCLETEIKRSFVPSLPKGARLASAVTARLQPPISAPDAFEIQTTMTVAVSSGRIPVYFDAIGFADGQGEVTLQAQAAESPPSRPVEQQLAKKLLARARAALG